jgi:hypothetical protein
MQESFWDRESCSKYNVKYLNGIVRTAAFRDVRIEPKINKVLFWALMNAFAQHQIDLFHNPRTLLRLLYP